MFVFHPVGEESHERVLSVNSDSCRVEKRDFSEVICKAASD